jgi:hypothetical protein
MKVASAVPSLTSNEKTSKVRYDAREHAHNRRQHFIRRHVKSADNKESCKMRQPVGWRVSRFDEQPNEHTVCEGKAPATFHL